MGFSCEGGGRNLALNERRMRGASTHAQCHASSQQRSPRHAGAKGARLRGSPHSQHAHLILRGGGGSGGSGISGGSGGSS